MIPGIESILAGKGLTQITYLHELLNAGYFVDTNYLDESMIPLYVVGKKPNLTHDLLNLYGVHWRYDWFPETNGLMYHDGDTNAVFSDIAAGKVGRRSAVFAFTRRYLEQFVSLWIFQEETDGWQFIESVVKPQYQKDFARYTRKKKEARTT